MTTGSGRRDSGIEMSDEFNSITATTADSSLEEGLMGENDHRGIRSSFLQSGQSGERPPSQIWNVFGQRCSRSFCVFIGQIILIYVVVCLSLYNLTVGNSPTNLWIALLASGVGYILPAPSLPSPSSSSRKT